MENQFYRNVKPEKFLKKIVKRAARNKRRTALIIFLFLGFLYLLFDNRGIITRIKLELQRKEWQERLKADSAETKRLEEQIKSLETDKKAIEKVARERYGMKREGETVYQIKKEK